MKQFVQKGQEDSVNSCKRRQPGKEAYSWRRSWSKQAILVLEPGNMSIFIDVLQKKRQEPELTT